MSHYGIILILLPISMAGVLARPHNEHRHPHEGSQAKNHNIDSKWNEYLIDNSLDKTSDEINMTQYYTPKCAFRVEDVPCEQNVCPQKFWKHIKCEPSAFTLYHNGQFCVQMFRTVNFPVGNTEKRMKLFTGCVLVTYKQMEELTVNTSS